ncbi:uncharacterized protein LOC106717036 [Papilio machaon]|uniref:uncharacterized protein LOC106717036 n=1 Tax=Papilio machaon TaxID=76193 RepID=UPI001E663740|nr:uncharacterized protein LOC106717036 [Papilio machaon]
MQTKAEDHCVCWRPYDEVYRHGPRAYRAGRGLLALEDWRRDPALLWLHHVPTNNGLQTIDYILGSDDTCFWSIPDVERYFVGDLHCESVLFPAQYPTLPLHTPHGNHLWRTHTAQKRSPFSYLKEFHICLQTTMKRMELEERQMERMIVSDRLIHLDTMDYYKRKKYFQSLLNILSFQDGLQLVCFENLRCSRLEGVRLIQQLACFNAHSLKYLFLWRFFDCNENPLLVNYSYITGSGAYIPRPSTAHCFSRSLGELLNLRVLALEYGHLADGTGNALLSLLSILKRPHFRLQVLCVEEHTPGRAEPALGGGGLGVPDGAWRRVASACPDLYLVMLFYRMSEYEHVRRFLSPSLPLREAHLHNGTRLRGAHLDLDSFLRHVAYYYASTLVTLSVQQRSNAAVPLRATLERLPALARLMFVGAVHEEDLRDLLVLVACGVCYRLEEMKILVEADTDSREHWKVVLSRLKEEFSDIMKLFDIEFTLSLHKF